MSRIWRRRYLLPLLLLLLGLLLLLRIFTTGTAILIPEDVDAVILVLLLGVLVVFALHSLVRVWMHYLRLRTMRQVRRETLAEHGRFLRRLDHELKNPLTTMRAGLRTLALTDLDERQLQIVKVMEDDTLRLSHLVADLRKVAELEAQPLDLHTFDLNQFLREIEHSEEERFEEGGRRLYVAVENKGEASWTADEDLLSLAIHNLLDNSFKYTRPGDAVQLILRADHELYIEVADTGEGIAAGDLPHIWEELYRGEQREESSGSGIGLALVKAIVERHGGAVSVQSSPGEGTTVSLQVPRLT